MEKYFKKVKDMLSRFKQAKVSQVPHMKNKQVDALANLTSSLIMWEAWKILVDFVVGP